MKTPLHPDLLEATRLTRAGQLTEATALLKGLFGGVPGASVAPSSASVRDMLKAPARRLMAKAKLPTAPAPRAKAPPPPPGAQFLARSFTNAAGTRAYKLYIPSTGGGEARPLVVMLHGCTQDADDFAAGTNMNAVAEEHGCLVAYPTQPASANSSKCWNWFNPGDQTRDRGEPSLLAGLTRQIMRDHAVDPGRVYVAGLSAGGAAAAALATLHPELYAAVGVHSGLPCGSARDLPSALAAMRSGARGADGPPIPTIVFHGDRDRIVHPGNGHGVVAQSRAASDERLRPVTRRGQSAGGRAYSQTRHLDAGGRSVVELWTVHGGEHAWFGGSPAGSYTDPKGPDASREMLRFFLTHRKPA